MIVRPYLIARYGVYLAIAVAALSVLLAVSVGTAFDTALFRALFIFVLFTAFAFGAEAVIATAPPSAAYQAEHYQQPTKVQTDHAESGEESLSELEEDAA